MNVRVFLLALLWANQALSQGFAGLGTEAEGFAMPAPDYRLSFPRDHGPHPDYRIEWWYLTATLQGEDGRDYGVQWTLFRSALAPGEAEGWQSPQVWMGHAAVTSAGQHHYAERLARGGVGQAGVTAEPFRAFIDDWRMEGIDEMRLTARGDDFAYDLDLSAQGPLVLNGVEGYSVKSPDGQASHYFSQPFYEVTGTLTLPEGSVEVTGDGWLDREWSSQPLSEDQDGWDWFSLQFDTGARLMGFELRGSETVFSSATWIAPDGTTTPFADGALRATPLETRVFEGREIPTTWRVELPARGVDVTVEALNPAAWMGVSFPYWEGPVRVSGSHSGRGYLEMTGY
ncbi:MAG: lipocalin-like domain-containing protein [Nioella sp.]